MRSTHLDEEEEMIRSSLRDFLEAEIAPELPEADREPMSKADAIEYQKRLANSVSARVTSRATVSPTRSRTPSPPRRSRGSGRR